MEIQNLRECIQKIPSNIRLEAVGENTDIYLNLFPILFSAPTQQVEVFTKVGNSLINEFGSRDDCLKSKPNVVFQDLSSGHLEQICDVPEYKIVRTTATNYDLSAIKKEKSVVFVLEYLDAQNIRFF